MECCLRTFRCVDQTHHRKVILLITNIPYQKHYEKAMTNSQKQNALNLSAIVGYIGRVYLPAPQNSLSRISPWTLLLSLPPKSCKK